jgi:hypothetical protein
MRTSTMKLMMEVSLFQLSPVSKNTEWKPMIDTWFRKFRVNIYLNKFFYYDNLVNLLILMN